MNEVTSISSKERTLYDAIVKLRSEPENAAPAYLATFLIQCTLPHRDPGNVPFWKRKNGHWTLRIEQGRDHNCEPLGYPYGTLPRLLLVWLITEAKRTNNKRINIGHTLTEFMNKLGLNTRNGTGPRSDTARIKNAMDRLFSANITFYNHHKIGKHDVLDTQYMHIASETYFQWNNEDPTETPAWGSWVELSQELYNKIQQSSVPCDMRALQAFKSSSLLLDLYMLCNWIGANLGERPQHWITWKMLGEQLGMGYADQDNIKKKIKIAMRKVKLAHPGLNFKYDDKRGGLVILPSLPAIPRKIEAGG